MRHPIRLLIGISLGFAVGINASLAADEPTPATPAAEVATPPTSPPPTESPEQAGAQALAARARDGEVVWLEVGGAKVLALYREQRSMQPRGVALLLHGMNQHADWPGVISTLRRALPEGGWSTLSLQLAPLAGGDKPYAVLVDNSDARITAALAWLKTKGITRVALIGQAWGAGLAAHYATTTPNAGVVAVIGIGLPGRKDTDSRLYMPDVVGKLTVPVLDIYGSRDQDHVLATAPQRLDAMHQAAARTTAAARLSYRQEEVPGADAQFTGLETTLSKQVLGFLRRYAK